MQQQQQQQPNADLPHPRQPDGAPQHYSILCAGLNAHSQLQAGTTASVRGFRPLDLPPDRRENVDVLFAGWSTTVLQSQGHIWSQGFQKLADGEVAAAGTRPRSVFGDHNGLLGLLDKEGNVSIVASEDPPASEPQPSTLQPLTTDSSPLLGHIALSSTSRISLTFKQAPNGRLCHIAEFENPANFLAWYRDPSDAASYPDKHHMLPGRPKQLLANTASFLLLMEDGQVYSWGDARYQSLGRAVVGEGAEPADRPAVVEALGGLRVERIAAGGWMGAAVSGDRALYLWGAASAPGAERGIKCLRDAGAGEVALVEIPGGDGEPLDVVDVGVGDAHVVVVAADGGHNRLYVVGDNGDGQLGVDEPERFVEDWTEAPIAQSVHRVVCGPKSTYALVPEP